jgi:ubiquinone/menaquinone biosynthesis C-methylase UbiE
MSGSPAKREDDWSRIESPGAVADAIRKLERYARSPAEQAARRRYLDLLDLRPGMKVVDVGAGSGLISLEMAERVGPGGKVVALDPSAPLLDAARKAAIAAGCGRIVEGRVGDARAIPFPDGSFDRALCHWVLLHVADQERVLAEMRRVVSPGGKVACVEMDWETQVVFPGGRELTRRILNFNTDRHIDGWMGRRLPALFSDLHFVDVTVDAITNTDDGSRGPEWLEFLRGRAENARAGGIITEAEGGEWIGAIEVAADERRYFFAVTQFVVTGVVPA